MKRFSIGCLIAVFLLAPAMAEEVPFATPPYQPFRYSGRHARQHHGDRPAPAYQAVVAGKAKNWDVMDYEAQKLEDDFVTAAGHYGGLPIELVVRANTPLKRIMEAAKAKDYPGLHEGVR